MGKKLRDPLIVYAKSKDHMKVFYVWKSMLKVVEVLEKWAKNGY